MLGVLRLLPECHFVIAGGCLGKVRESRGSVNRNLGMNTCNSCTREFGVFAYFCDRFNFELYL